MIAMGQLRPDELLWHDGLPHWQTVEQWCESGPPQPTMQNVATATRPPRAASMFWGITILVVTLCLVAFCVQDELTERRASRIGTSQKAIEVPNQSADQARENCLDRVQEVYGTLSTGSFDVGSVARQAQEIQNCREGGAAPVDVVGDLYSRADQIQERGGYACNGIGIQLKQVLEAQGPMSPLIAELLGRAEENGCL